MKKVLLCTNVPAPYSVDFYNELGKYCELTVVYELKCSKERNPLWKGDDAKSFKEVYLDLKPYGVDTGRGSGLKKFIKDHPSDFLIFANYASPASLEAVIWCKMHKRKYIINWDGGFFKEENILKKTFKKFILGGANKHLISCDELNRYLLSLGISKERIFKYPFTSIREKDIIDQQIDINELETIKNRLDIKEAKTVISVGRFSYEKGYGKGYDLLLMAAKQCPKSIGFYIVGDEPTEEFIKMKKEMKLDNVHFVGFKTKKELAEYYLVSDLFVLLTRGDVWGLVVNEAMSYGKPVITSDKCIAGLELVKEGENGYIVSLNDVNNIATKIQVALGDEKKKKQMGQKSLDIIKHYTIEAMAQSVSRALDLV